MHPAFSVIFLTTLIGAGQGLFMALVTGQVYSLANLLEPQDSVTFYATGSLLALILLDSFKLVKVRTVTGLIVGGGLAGCEATWQLARRGVVVDLHEMRPVVEQRMAAAATQYDRLLKEAEDQRRLYYQAGGK